jgi:acyl-CoA synthetase (AMP-forming)/AMP-acid ligase II
MAEGSKAGASSSDAFRDPEYDPNVAAAVLFTSGTEADPKGALHTSNSLLANNRGLARLLHLTEQDSIFMASPVGHGTGYGFGTRLAIYLGSKLVLLDQWDPARALQLMRIEGCAYTHASTTFAVDVLEDPSLAETQLTSLRYFVSGGANVPDGFVARMKDAIGAQLLRLYGQTEAFMTTINRPDDSDDLLDAFDGKAAPGVEVAIWEDDGMPLPPGKEGEIVCRGPHRCFGFLGDPDRTARSITDGGWLKMGDLGTLSADGYLSFVGRKKEVINRGGYKFSPREIEDLLLGHPTVLRVAVVKMPDPRLGERACAFVVAKDKERPSLEGIVEYLRARGVAPYKLPERLEVVDVLPSTPSGKVQKFVLEERLAKGEPLAAT